MLRSDRPFQPPGLGRARRAITLTSAVTSADHGIVIDATTGTYDVTATAAATLGSGFSFGLYNSGTGTVTFNPAGTETIRTPSGTAATLAFTQGQGAFIQTDGSNWEVVCAIGLAASPSTPLTVRDNAFTITDETDTTKTLVTSLGAMATGVDLVIDAGAQTIDATISLPVLLGNDTLVSLATVQTLTGAKTFSAAVVAGSTLAVTGATTTAAITSTSATGVTTLAAATQDAVRIIGRAGGTTSLISTITTAALTASRTWTLPDRSDTIAGLGAQTFTGTQTFVATTQSGNWAQTGTGTGSTGTGQWSANGSIVIASGKTLTFVSGVTALLTGIADTAQNLDIDSTAVSTAQFEIRVFRLTNTSAARKFTIYKGDGTSTAAHQLFGDGSSSFGTTVNLSSGVGHNFGMPTGQAFTSQRVIGVNGVATSAATGDYSGIFVYGWGTAAAAFTCPVVSAWRNNVATLGAGSTITNLNTISAIRNTLGTNNACLVYGTTFAQTGNWFLYNNTVDPSYLGTGNTLINSATDDTIHKLQVAGRIRAVGRSPGVTSTVTAASTTTLTMASNEIQTWTGSTAGKVITFPAANAAGAGFAVMFCINNQSSVTVTPTRAGSDTFQGGGTTDPVLAGATQWYASDGISVWLKI